MQMPKDIQIAIIAGGMATRLGELTRDEPKSLLKIHGKPFIVYQIERINKQGITDIIICAGHMGEKIEQYLGNGKQSGRHTTGYCRCPEESREFT